ncbi:NitT/TauT family transport system permease protein [Bradyrhizobium sp. JR7.2]|uniref:ABC transporter permease n=1 Tax=Bradyrhizobium barranii TaxID=2992140 RepID=A0ABY3QSG3_9BRAD|nr:MULTISPECIES: ABC transporter permease [Bradyrhizobium]UFW88526.1 ABC transporter permease [Bradyrhizobium japonicum]WFT97258.1 ABC transporter permease [Bradyrhizobium barranii]
MATAIPARPAGIRWMVRGLSILACIALWQVASTTHLNLGIVTFRNVPPPVEVAQSALALFRSPKLTAHITSSLWRVFAGYGAAVVIGVILGFAIGRSRAASDLLLPPLELLRPIPAVAWIPLSILIFPSSELSMIYITFIGALFPIVLNTVHGVANVDRRLVASARSLGAGELAILREVVLPDAAPSIVTGLAIGMGTSWFCLVTAEMISGQFGIGYYTWEAYTLQNYADIIVGMLIIGLLGMGSSWLLTTAGRLLMPWRSPKVAR